MASDKGHQGDKQGAVNRRPRGPAELFGPNTNHQKTATRALTDQEIMDFLESKGVSLKELCSYLIPIGLLNQHPNIDPITQAIIAVINSMARTRRMILYRKLTKTDVPAEISQMKTQLARWAADVQEMQGRITALEGHCLLIHPQLVSDIDLVL